MSRHSTSSSHGTNDPAIGHSMDSDIHELQHSISELLSQYCITRRDDTGRLRQFQQANELQQEVNTLRTELDFLIQIQRSLTQQPTLQASLSPPVVSQNYTPPRCRLPSDMPKFKRPTVEAQSTVQDFISVFERKLKADSYSTKKYVDALTACCHPEKADWVEPNITHCQSWDDTKDRFLRHFIDEDMETLYAYELEGILKNPKESIHAFADRYLHAIRLTKADPQLETCSSHPLPDKAIRPSQKRRQSGQSNTARECRHSLWNRANTSDAISTYENQCKTG
ncbi:hypothetical protein BASA81_015911 [Batrachochytrium salamandrivorans]|nr:hypothetical protein BASA81_015911 [Batrachochytrium salamandrivorans]